MKKLMTMITLAILLVVVAVVPVSAAEIQPLLVGDGVVRGYISRGSGSFSVTASTDGATIKTEVSGVLYEDGLLWDTQVGSCANSSSGSACTATGSYVFQNNKKYRLDYSATFYYTNGTSETVSGSTTG